MSGADLTSLKVLTRRLPPYPPPRTLLFDINESHISAIVDWRRPRFLALCPILVSLDTLALVLHLTPQGFRSSKTEVA